MNPADRGGAPVGCPRRRRTCAEPFAVRRVHVGAVLGAVLGAVWFLGSGFCFPGFGFRPAARARFFRLCARPIAPGVGQNLRLLKCERRFAAKPYLKSFRLRLLPSGAPSERSERGAQPPRQPRALAEPRTRGPRRHGGRRAGMPRRDAHARAGRRRPAPPTRALAPRPPGAARARRQPPSQLPAKRPRRRKAKRPIPKAAIPPRRGRERHAHGRRRGTGRQPTTRRHGPRSPRHRRRVRPRQPPPVSRRGVKRGRLRGGRRPGLADRARGGHAPANVGRGESRGENTNDGSGFRLPDSGRFLLLPFSTVEDTAPATLGHVRAARRAKRPPRARRAPGFVLQPITRTPRDTTRPRCARRAERSARLGRAARPGLFSNRLRGHRAILLGHVARGAPSEAPA